MTPADLDRLEAGKPLAIDLFCGLGGWTEGLLAEGYYVVGFDIERHVYGAHRYPAQLVIQDVLTLHGKQFKDAALIVASPPCQAYSYRAMPWKRAKALPPPDNTLFEACFRIQREACEAAGRHIPLVVENVRGAQKWVGRARFNFGSFYFWGDVPALMPIVKPRSVLKAGIAHRSAGSTNFHGHGRKGVPGVPLSSVGLNVANAQRYRAEREGSGLKCGGDWFGLGVKSAMRNHSSKSDSRKAASAMIAKIPFEVASWIARVFKPTNCAVPFFVFDGATAAWR